MVRAQDDACAVKAKCGAVLVDTVPGGMGQGLHPRLWERRFSARQERGQGSRSCAQTLTAPQSPPSQPWGPSEDTRIRRACFSFTGASWLLMALLMLMACGDTEAAVKSCRGSRGPPEGGCHPSPAAVKHGLL